MKKLTITADDFGAHPDIDRGIIDCIEAGSIDNVDCLVNNMITSGKHAGYDSLSAIAELAERFKTKIDNKDLSLGLHLTLTSGKPVSKEAKERRFLIDGYGRFRKIHKHNYVKLNNSSNQKIIIAEYEEQLNSFNKAFSQGPDHVSFHAGIGHLTWNMTESYFGFCSAKSLPVRNPLLMSRLDDVKALPDAPTMAYAKNSMMMKIATSEAIKMIAGPPFENPGVLIPNIKGEQIYQQLLKYKELGLATTDYFIDNFYCRGSESLLSHLTEHLFPASFEMVVHPVHSDVLKTKGLVPNGIKTKHLNNRTSEWRVLKDPQGKVDSLLQDFHGGEWSRFRLTNEALTQ
jgi:predicted glycoside hydrolase/deacetylase ChbG (UPF0249 family)